MNFTLEQLRELRAEHIDMLYDIDGQGVCVLCQNELAPCEVQQLCDDLIALHEAAAMIDKDDLFGLRAVWYVDHADGTTEDIVLAHGDVVEDSTGTVGQVLFERAVSDGAT